MIGNVEALKVLYVKLGGSLTDTYSDIAGGIPVGDYDLISDCILACAKKGSGSGSLPTPGTAGNVLTSTGTEWESAEPTDNDFVVTSTLDWSQMSITALSESTVAQMAAAAEAHKNVRLIATDDELGVVFSVDLNTYSNDASDFVGGGAVSLADDTNMYCTVYISRQGTVSVIPYQMHELPAASASENGKLLGVVNGAYSLVDSKIPLVLTLSLDNGDLVIDNATASEIYAAYTAHRPVYIDYPPMSSRSYLTIASYTDSEHYSFGFFNAALSGTDIQIAVIVAENSLTLDIKLGTVAVQ